MKFLAAVFVLIILVPYSSCLRRGLAIHFEKADKDLVDGKDPTRTGSSTDEVGEGRTYTVSDGERTSTGTVDELSDYDDFGGRVIYPTETSKTVRIITMDKPKDVAEEKTKIPESVLIAMNDVHTADEFLRRFVAHGSNASEKDFAGSAVLPIPGTAGRKGLSGGANPLVTTQFAGCQPQKSVVKVVENSESDGVLLWPPCVYLPRCGGCCTSELMTCRPTAISYVNVTVLQARYTGPKSNPFANEGVRIVSMEQHDKCACGCKELQEDCTLLQEYRKNECRCVCANQNEAVRCQERPNKFWDSHDCTCKCRSTTECSSGLYFNIKTCRCETLRFFFAARAGTISSIKNEITDASTTPQ